MDDDCRFLALAADELEDAAHAVRELEAARTAVLRADRSSLRHLAEIAPEPYSTLLEEQRDGLGRLAEELGDVLIATRALASDSMRLPALLSFLR